jgi:S-adenosylmethionine hydrolase
MNAITTQTFHGRNIFCALAACILTVLLLGEIGQASVQAAQRAAQQEIQA